jgi:hypothetical protein
MEKNFAQCFMGPKTPKENPRILKQEGISESIEIKQLCGVGRRNLWES